MNTMDKQVIVTWETGFTKNKKEATTSVKVPDLQLRIQSADCIGLTYKEYTP